MSASDCCQDDARYLVDDCLFFATQHFAQDRRIGFGNWRSLNAKFAVGKRGWTIHSDAPDNTIHPIRRKYRNIIPTWRQLFWFGIKASRNCLQPWTQRPPDNVGGVTVKVMASFTLAYRSFSFSI